MTSRQKSGFILLIGTISFWLIIPGVRGNPVSYNYSFILNQGLFFLILFIIPFVLLFTFLTECGIYFVYLSKKLEKKRKICELALFINLITVPITQMVAYLNALYLVNDLWKYIVIEGIVIFVELVLFRNEIKKHSKKLLHKKTTFLIVFISNAVSFLVGFIFFEMLFGVFSNLNQYQEVNPYIGIATYYFVRICFIAVISSIIYFCTKNKAIEEEDRDGYECCGCMVILLIIIIVFLVL